VRTGGYSLGIPVLLRNWPMGCVGGDVCVGGPPGCDLGVGVGILWECGL
jgi:hypothetical protein